MATTFKISNGDVVIPKSTGRPRMIGNPIVEGNVTRDPGNARSKIRQDLIRGLSLGRVRNGTTANIQSIIGTVTQIGQSAVALLLNRQIRDMVSAIIREQNARPNVRPPNEKIQAISVLKVFPDNTRNDNTSFRFRLGIRTRARNIEELSGIVE